MEFNPHPLKGNPTIFQALLFTILFFIYTLILNTLLSSIVMLVSFATCSFYFNMLESLFITKISYYKLYQVK